MESLVKRRREGSCVGVPVRLRLIDAAIHVEELSVPGEVTVLSDPGMVVAKIAPPHVEKEVEEEVVEGEEAAEEAAEEEGAEEPAAEGDEKGKG